MSIARRKTICVPVSSEAEYQKLIKTGSMVMLQLPDRLMGLRNHPHRLEISFH
jgi:hypothetical protein